MRAERAPRARPLRVAVAGLGVVGGGVASRLQRTSDFRFCAALVREPFKERPGLDVDQVTNDHRAFLASKPDIVVDALPDGKAGLALIREALSGGVSVVTANKQAIAGALDALSRRAEQAGARFAYCPSVGGGAPFIETAFRARKRGDIVSLEAVLNGTVNFILTALAANAPFETAIRTAQERGFAEPDSSADLSGADARAKISILSYAAFGREIAPRSIEVEALDAVGAARFAKAGGIWKQVARIQRSENGSLRASVRYERKDHDPLFANALFETNVLRLHLADGRRVECCGRGAGRAPTVASIFSDLARVGRALSQADPPRSDPAARVRDEYRPQPAAAP